MYGKILRLDAGPATLIPLLHVPLLKNAPREEGAHKVIPDNLGGSINFHGDFSGYHIYMIASSYKKGKYPFITSKQPFLNTHFIPPRLLGYFNSLTAFLGCPLFRGKISKRLREIS